MYRTAAAPAIPTCPTCKVREVSFDVEGGVLSTYRECFECFSLRADAPRCTAKACLTGGHTSERAELVVETLGLVRPQYRCPRCDFVGNAIEWAERTGRLAGESDVAYAAKEPSMAFLVPTRREVQTKKLIAAFIPARNVLAAHDRYTEASLTYARAYLAATA